jgi:hypothetical protein
VTLTECSTRTRFEISLETDRSLFLFKREVSFELPRAVFCGMRINVSLVLAKTLPEIVGGADIEMAWDKYGLQNIDVVHKSKVRLRTADAVLRRDAFTLSFLRAKSGACRAEAREEVRVRLWTATASYGATLSPARSSRAKAGEGNRTLALSLGSSRSTIELHPHQDLYAETRSRMRQRATHAGNDSTATNKLCNRFRPLVPEGLKVANPAFRYAERPKRWIGRKRRAVGPRPRPGGGP